MGRWIRIAVVCTVIVPGALSFAAFRIAGVWSRASAELNRIGAPRHFDHYRGSKRGGGLFCIDTCPSVVHSYDVSAVSLGEAQSELRAQLIAAGYHVGPSRSCAALSFGSTVRITCGIDGAKSGYQAELGLIIAPSARTPIPRRGVALPIDVPSTTPIARVDISVTADRLL